MSSNNEATDLALEGMVEGVSCPTTITNLQKVSWCDECSQPSLAVAPLYSSLITKIGVELCVPQDSLNQVRCAVDGGCPIER
eukprot:15366888-Ditylum_brightwellii.AAC.1